MLAIFDRHKYWIVLALFAFSLVAPAVFESEYGIARACSSGHWNFGYELFLIGPLGLLIGQIGWLANPAMLVAFLLRRHKEFAIMPAALAIFLIFITSFSFTTMPNDVAGNPICKLGLGYYLWLLSSITLLAATIASLYKSPAPG